MSGGGSTRDGAGAGRESLLAPSREDIAWHTVNQLCEIEYNAKWFAETFWPRLMNGLAHGTPEHRRNVFEGAIEHCQ